MKPVTLIKWKPNVNCHIEHRDTQSTGVTEVMDFPNQCGAAAVGDKTNIENLISVCLIVYVFVHLSLTLCL